MEVEALAAAVEALVELLGQEELTAAVDTLSHLLHEEKLTAAVESLTREVRQLGLIMDEIREDLVWAVRNDRLEPASTNSWRPSLSSTTEDESPEAPPVAPPAAAQDAPSPRADQRSFFG